MVEECVVVLIEVRVTIMIFGGGLKPRINESREKALSMLRVFSFERDSFNQKFQAYSLFIFIYKIIRPKTGPMLELKKTK